MPINTKNPHCQNRIGSFHVDRSWRRRNALHHAHTEQHHKSVKNVRVNLPAYFQAVTAARVRPDVRLTRR